VGIKLLVSVLYFFVTFVDLVFERLDLLKKVCILGLHLLLASEAVLKSEVQFRLV
jgi:hypothetical protein